MPTPLDETLRKLAGVMRYALRPWWIIGSAAVALHGVVSVVPRDIDVLLDADDLARVIDTLGIEAVERRPDAIFRSERFAIWRHQALPVEFMAGLRAHGTLLSPATRIAFGGVPPIFAPDADELIDILHQFGRPKDIDRARSLQAIAALR